MFVCPHLRENMLSTGSTCQLTRSRISKATSPCLHHISWTPGLVLSRLHTFVHLGKTTYRVLASVSQEQYYSRGHHNMLLNCIGSIYLYPLLLTRLSHLHFHLDETKCWKYIQDARLQGERARQAFKGHRLLILSIHYFFEYLFDF